MTAKWTQPLDKALITKSLMLYADYALEATAGEIEDRARTLAPVRKVFAGQLTPKSQARVAKFKELLMLRRGMNKIGYRPAYRRKYGRVGLLTVSAHRRRAMRDTEDQGMDRRMVTKTGRGAYAYGGEEPLSARGRYELSAKAKGRAIIKISRQTRQLGGRLRDSIRAQEIMPGKWEVRASVPYAKYVEFGTRRSVAQPFLLPAFKATRNSFKKSVAKAVGGKVK